ncbi:hypothetical protein FACS1894154_06730 [Betaproteobacteria bacterium]|nr:hypothetical protein FACS1894154_06730 [Betaproteobacteria bacterium]GHU29387.1 hypothetical protein FACS189497_07270 [Betaproteobacteria bacterium]
MTNQSTEGAVDANSASAVGIISVLLMVVLAAVLFLTSQNNESQKLILADSIKQQLIATSIAARELIDPDLVDAIHDAASIENHRAAYNQALLDLRALRDEVGATYIYVLKYIDGQPLFIMDTDEKAADILGDPYKLSEVHEQAFSGVTNADVLNVVDEWGSFNTGAAPIYKEGKVIGIVSTDMEDAFLQRSMNTAVRNILILIVTLVLILGVLLAVIIILLRRVARMQKHLYRSANYDHITNLPNRNYLFNYLKENSEDSQMLKISYAVLFVDLDNFKNVNDRAGHDVGDTLLRMIAAFLEKSSSATKSLYPDVGLPGLSARIGGDEFLLILPGIANGETAIEFTQKLLNSFAEENDLKRYIKEFGVGLSIGIALHPAHATDYDELIKNADIAMYRAKAAGKNRYVIYSAHMNDNIDKLELIVRNNCGGKR